MTQFGKKNVVLGFATNQEIERVESFCRSLREVYSSSDCDIVLFVHEVDDRLACLSESLAVELYYTPNNYTPLVSLPTKVIKRLVLSILKCASRHIPSPKKNGLLLHDGYTQLLKLWHHPLLARWFSYQEFFHIRTGYRRCLLTDIKDVVFQGPFFELTTAEGLHLFDQSEAYGTNNCDSSWYRQAYGDDALQQVSGKPALCAGTIIGDTLSICSLIDCLCREIADRPFGAIDQVIFNNLYYSGKIESPAAIYVNGQGPVLTLSNDQTRNLFSVTEHGIILKDGQLAPIVHMYDRHDDTRRFFTNKSI